MDIPEAVVQAIIGVLGLIISWVFASGWWRTKVDRQDAKFQTTALMALESGVQEVYEEYVREIKKASEDGTLTKEERAEARNKAIALAKQFAAQNGINLLKVFTQEQLPAIIDRIVNKRKGRA